MALLVVGVKINIGKYFAQFRRQRKPRALPLTDFRNSSDSYASPSLIAALNLKALRFQSTFSEIRATKFRQLQATIILL